MPNVVAATLVQCGDIHTKKRHRHDQWIMPAEDICDLPEQWLRHESREDERIRDPYVLFLATDGFCNRW